jgi:hypothetical protein
MPAASEVFSIFGSVRINTSVFHTEIRKVENQLQTTTGKVSDFEKKTSAGFARAGRSAERFGQSLFRSVSLPLAAIGAASVKAFAGVDSVNNKLISATGSAERASAKFRELIQVSKDSPGVLTSVAADVYAFLKPMEGLADKTINPLITALGRLKLADSQFQGKEFARNLQQIFSEGFEIRDLKEANTKFARFGEIVKKQFNLKGSDLGSIKEGLADLKKSGKLTFDSFVAGFAEGVNNDSALGKLRDDVGTRFAKTFERLSFAFAPVGEAVLDVLEPIVDRAVPFIESLGETFKNLSPGIKTAIVGIGGLAAAIAPAVILAGKLSAALATLTGGATLSAIFAKVAVAVGVAAVAIGTLAAAAAVAKKAWDTNFLGLRDVTVSVFSKVSETVQTVMTEIRGQVENVGGQIVGWWRDNYPLIKETVQTVSDAAQSIIQAFLGRVYEFWRNHGESITRYVKDYWEQTKAITGTILTQVGNIVKLGMQIINGDWQGAWETFVEGIKTAARLVTEAVSAILNNVKNILSALIPIAIDYGLKFATTIAEYATKAVVGFVKIVFTLPQRVAEVAPKMVAAGMQIGEAVWQGIKDGLSGASSLSLGAGAFDSVLGSARASAFEGVLGAGAGVFDKAGKSAAGFGDAADKAGKKAKEALTPMQELKKGLVDVTKEFNFLNTSFEARGLTARIGEIQKGVSSLREIIGLRKELGFDLDFNIPFENLGFELEALTELKDKISAAKDMLAGFYKTIADGNEEKSNLTKVIDLLKDKGVVQSLGAETVALLKHNAIIVDGMNKTKAFADAKKALAESGRQMIASLAEQIKLFGVTDKVEQQRIKNQLHLARIQSEGIAKGWTQKQINEAQQLAALDHQRVLEQTKLLSLKEKLVGTKDFISDLLGNIRIGDLGGQLSNLEKFQNLLGDAEITKYIRERANAIGYTFTQMVGILEQAAKLKDDGLAERLRIIPEDINLSLLDVLRDKLKGLTDSALTLKDALAGSFANMIDGISGSFGQAVATWDGTLKGFFKSVAQGFGQMAQQIIADLVRILIYKALLNLFGSLAGGIGGGASAGGAGSAISNWQNGLGFGFASGGFTGNAPANQVAGLVHGREFVIKADAVKALTTKFGTGFLESLNSFKGFASGGFTSPMPAMAGTHTGGQTSTDNRTYNINVHMPNGSGGSAQMTGAQIAREVMSNLRKEEMRNR